ncbi:MaoC family dehydratase [Salimicrobium halophilum]|uniref:Acyl dehydratase n=1 Tax=Salimicrobium halophilum TaxID=86666 RepID=A0A1G8VH60_9BACI|nr:MaoC/PaaZ C-terminal domain-containing protein [Salimicrobium halophilum]SDJ65456.1 Acyl dehydratase [Salimicrobium halophilum]
MLGKKRKLGKKIDELNVGDTYETSCEVKDKDLLIYLGLTDDANPLYLQHDYASRTPFERPIVPSIMLQGMITSAVSMHLPGPGSHITYQEIQYPVPVYHYETLHLLFKIEAIDEEENLVHLQVKGTNASDEEVMSGKLHVIAPYEPDSLNSISLENFY